MSKFDKSLQILNNIVHKSPNGMHVIDLQLHTAGKDLNWWKTHPPSLLWRSWSLRAESSDTKWWQTKILYVVNPLTTTVAI